MRGDMIPRAIGLTVWMGLCIGVTKTAMAGAPVLAPDRLYDSRAMLAQVAAQENEPAVMEANGPSNSRVAMLYSLLLPGLGEYTLGHHDRAKIFFLAEGAIWTSYAIFRVQGAHRKDIYHEFARVNAGVASRDDDEFYRIIGNYVSSDGPFSANEQIRREARANYPDDRAKQEEYYQEHAYTGDDTWTWQSQAMLDTYQDMRDASESAYHKSDFSLGLAIANRLISVVDTGILAAKKSRANATTTGFRWNIEAEPSGARLLVSRQF
jgi:hypothetical protein